jgi:hypothetical protein
MRVRAWSRREALTAGVVVFTLFVTVSRTLRAPNEFAMTHWLFDYRFGFMKRGLVGSICALVASFFGGSVSPAAITVLSSVLLASFFSMLLLLLFQALRPLREEPRVPLLALVFVSSPFITLSAHFMGYFDGWIYVVAALAMSLAMAGRPFWAGLVSALGVLVHESYLVVGLPLVVLATHQTGEGDDPRLIRRRHSVALLPPLIVFGLICAALEFRNAAELRSRWTEHLSTVGFVGEQGSRTAVWNNTAFSQFSRDQLPLLPRRLIDPDVFGPGLPTLGVLMVFLHSAYRVRPLGRLSLLTLFSVLSPLVLHAIAWDSARIAAYPICGALFALWIVARTRAPGKVSSVVVFLALPALLVNIFTRTPLTDGLEERLTDLDRLLLYAPALGLALSTLGSSRGSATGSATPPTRHRHDALPSG